jgi:hypothetical protein
MIESQQSSSDDEKRESYFKVLIKSYFNVIQNYEQLIEIHCEDFKSLNFINVLIKRCQKN